PRPPPPPVGPPGPPGGGAPRRPPEPRHARPLPPSDRGRGPAPGHLGRHERSRPRAALAEGGTRRVAELLAARPPLRGRGRGECDVGGDRLALVLHRLRHLLRRSAHGLRRRRDQHGGDDDPATRDLVRHAGPEGELPPARDARWTRSRRKGIRRAARSDHRGRDRADRGRRWEARRHGYRQRDDIRGPPVAEPGLRMSIGADGGRRWSSRSRASPGGLGSMSRTSAAWSTWERWDRKATASANKTPTSRPSCTYGRTPASRPSR